MVNPHKIRYNNISSNELNILDLIMEVAFDSDSGETSSYLNREAIVSETYDGRRKHVMRYKYNESFSPKFTFVKKNFGDFTQEEVRQVLKWLTSKDTTAVLDVYYDHADDSAIVDWACIGNWTEINTYKLGNNRTVGIVATFEAITPYAMSDLDPVTKTISSTTDSKIIVNIDTDDNKPVYPRITINHGYGQTSTPHSVIRVLDGKEYTEKDDMVENTVYYNGQTYYWKTKSSTDPIYFHSSTTNPNLDTTSVRITNTYTDYLNQSKTSDAVIIKNNTPTESIVLDGANKIISSNNTKRIFGDNFNWKWLELYDGQNEITIEGNCEVTIEYREVRKVGEY